MKSNSTIKRSLIWNRIQTGGILFLIFFILESRFFGTHFTLFIWGGFLVFIGIYYFFKLELYQFPVVGILFGTAAWHYELAFHLNFIFTPFTFIIHLLVGFIASIFMMPTIVKAYKLEIHARQLFRLASQQVFDISNGFTNRPYTGGKTIAERKDILGLARFMTGSIILIFDSNADIIIYAFSMNKSPLSDPQLKSVSCITFDKEGNISVQISERDYRQYKNQLSFDQLCASFSNLFKQFLEYYKEGNEDRIITELKSV